MRKTSVIVLATGAMLLAPLQASAQRRADLSFPPGVQPPSFRVLGPVQNREYRDQYARMAATGFLAGAAGMAIGWYAGIEMAGANEAGVLVGGALMTTAIPLGVYWGNDHQGELPLALVASYGLGLAGFILVGTSWRHSIVQFGAILIPLTQLATSLWIVSAGTQ